MGAVGNWITDQEVFFFDTTGQLSEVYSVKGGLIDVIKFHL